MAKVINFGSINIDYVYQVPHFVQPGETLSSSALQVGLGGKGANQSVAIARAGVAVNHLGRLSKADNWAAKIIASAGVGTDSVERVDGSSGHAIIQVDTNGENAIVLHGGANQEFTPETLRQMFDQNPSAEYLLMQNECNLLDCAFAMAVERGIKVVLNPAPMTNEIRDLPLHQLNTLIVNQGEAEALSGVSNPDEMLNTLGEMIPNGCIVITLGAAGAKMLQDGVVTMASAPKIDAVDTTAAGDTFVGYFIAGLANGMDADASLNRACQAASITATRDGAIAAIPRVEELT